MAASSEFHIYVHNDIEENASPSSPSDDSKPNPKSPDKSASKKASTNQKIAKSMGLYIAQQTLSAGISRVGAITRSESLQRNVNDVMTLVGYGVMIATNPYVGIPAMLFDIGFKAFDQYVAIESEKRTFAINAERAGMGSVNYSR